MGVSCPLQSCRDAWCDGDGAGFVVERAIREARQEPGPQDRHWRQERRPQQVITPLGESTNRGSRRPDRVSTTPWVLRCLLLVADRRLVTQRRVSAAPVVESLNEVEDGPPRLIRIPELVTVATRTPASRRSSRTWRCRKRPPPSPSTASSRRQSRCTAPPGPSGGSPASAAAVSPPWRAQDQFGPQGSPSPSPRPSGPGPRPHTTSPPSCGHREPPRADPVPQPRSSGSPGPVLDGLPVPPGEPGLPVPPARPLNPGFPHQSDTLRAVRSSSQFGSRRGRPGSRSSCTICAWSRRARFEGRRFNQA